MMPNVPYGPILLIRRCSFSILNWSLAPGGRELLNNGLHKCSAIINMCSHSGIKTVASKAHNRRSCCSGESDMNTYEDFVSFVVVIQTEQRRLVRLLFSGVFAPLLPIKGLSFQLWFICWIKQDSIILLMDDNKINSCELRGVPPNMCVCVCVCSGTCTHTHTRA